MLPLLRASLLALLLGCSTAWALAIENPLPDPAQEARAQELFRDIRCVVCQSEAIVDSQAEIARDMRRAIRERVSAGDNSEDIKTYLVSRYGDYILMQPPLKTATAILWFGPLLILLAAVALAWRYFKGART